MEKLRKLNTEYEGKENIVILKLLGWKIKQMEQTCQIGVWMGFCATLKIQREKLGERRSGKVSGLVGGKQVSAWICAGAR